MIDRRGATLAMWIVMAACGPSDVSPTLGTVCMTLATPICSRAGVCTGDPSPMCAQDFIMGCCSTTTCGSSSTVTDLSQLDACRQDLKTWDCTMLGEGRLPASCPTFAPAK